MRAPTRAQRRTPWMMAILAIPTRANDPEVRQTRNTMGGVSALAPASRSALEVRLHGLGMVGAAPRLHEELSLEASDVTCGAGGLAEKPLHVRYGARRGL